MYLTLGEPLAQFMARWSTFAIPGERVGTPGFLEDIQRAIWSIDPSVPLWDVALPARRVARVDPMGALRAE